MFFDNEHLNHKDQILSIIKKLMHREIFSKIYEHDTSMFLGLFGTYDDAIIKRL